MCRLDEIKEQRETINNIAGLNIDLSDFLKCKIDVVPMSALSDSKFSLQVTKDMVLL